MKMNRSNLATIAATLTILVALGMGSVAAVMDDDDDVGYRPSSSTTTGTTSNVPPTVETVNTADPAVTCEELDKQGREATNDSARADLGQVYLDMGCGWSFGDMGCSNLADMRETASGGMLQAIDRELAERC